MQFDVMNIMLYLAIILFAAKSLGMLTRKMGLPQVVGMVVAGLLIGPAIIKNFGWSFQGIISPTPVEMDVLQTFSEIGVILILFSSGLETDFKEMKKSGLASTAIAFAGVLVPMLFGTVITVLFIDGFGGFSNSDIVMNGLLVGTILAATSVGITVETLREMGKLNTKVGTTVLSAAIIDDVLGIIALSIVTSLKGGGSIGMTLLKALGFFAFCFAVGIPARIFFKWLEKRDPHTRRLGIYGVVLCFVFAFVAEKFGIAAITGAFMAGLMLSGLTDSGYMERKVEVSGYMIFSPLFFAYIGISADFSMFKPSDLIFGLIIVAAAIIGKIVGCGGVARLFKYNGHDSATIGCGMVARGEVALAVYNSGKSLIYTGADGAILGIDPLVATIMLIIISSIVCPILLKMMFRKQKS